MTYMKQKLIHEKKSSFHEHSQDQTEKSHPLKLLPLYTKPSLMTSQINT